MVKERWRRRGRESENVREFESESGWEREIKRVILNESENVRKCEYTHAQTRNIVTNNPPCIKLNKLA